MKPRSNGALLIELEKNVREILAQREVSIADRLKAIEAGSRLLMIRHRIEGSGEGDDGKFFRSAAG